MSAVPFIEAFLLETRKIVDLLDLMKSAPADLTELNELFFKEGFYDSAVF